MNNDKNIRVKDFLPLGSVVNVKGMNRKIMIIEYLANVPEKVYPVREDDKDRKYFEYMGILWPDGDVDPTKRILFDHDDIDTVHFSGYINEESIELLNDLQKNMEVQ